MPSPTWGYVEGFRRQFQHRSLFERKTRTFWPEIAKTTGGRPRKGASGRSGDGERAPRMPGAAGRTDRAPGLPHTPASASPSPPAAHRPGGRPRAAISALPRSSPTACLRTPNASFWPISPRFTRSQRLASASPPRAARTRPGVMPRLLGDGAPPRRRPSVKHTIFGRKSQNPTRAARLASTRRHPSLGDDEISGLAPADALVAAHAAVLRGALVLRAPASALDAIGRAGARLSSQRERQEQRLHAGAEGVAPHLVAPLAQVLGGAVLARAQQADAPPYRLGSRRGPCWPRRRTRTTRGSRARPCP